MPSVRARKPTGSGFIAKRTEPPPRPPEHQQSPRADEGGQESFIPACICLRAYTRAYGRRPFGSGSESTTSSWRASKWASGSGDGGQGANLETREPTVCGLYAIRILQHSRQEWRPARWTADDPHPSSISELMSIAC